MNVACKPPDKVCDKLYLIPFDRQQLYSWGLNFIGKISSQELPSTTLKGMFSDGTAKIECIFLALQLCLIRFSGVWIQADAYQETVSGLRRGVNFPVNKETQISKSESRELIRPSNKPPNVREKAL